MYSGLSGILWPNVVDGEVADLLRCANKSATSWQQVVVMEFRRRHDTTPTCYGLVVYVVDLLQTCYGETGVMDFALKAAL